MNAERLLRHYERIADAPDAITRLRRFILDLAVRGKLVPQDANEEPASELLKRIAKERTRLVQEGVIKTRDMSLEITETQNPFEVPSAWRCVTLGSLLILMKNGLNVKPDKAIGKYKVTRIETISFEKIDLGRVGFVSEISDALVKQHLIKQGDILFSHINSEPHLGKTAISIQEDSTLIHGVNLLLLRASQNIDPSYLHLAIRQLRACGYFVSIAQRAVNQSSINQKNLGKTPIPLPPLAEQHRIVAKVDELMGLCDRLEAARTGREAVRDRLAAASLARLNAPDPETFQADARFALDALPALTSRPDQIKALRQTILNLAVRGKLVSQDPNDEPASELLKRIATEKERAGKREKVEAEIDNEEELGDLPPTWRAMPLIALGSWAIGSGFPKNEQGLESGPHFFLKVSDMNLMGNEKYITTSNNFIDDDAARRMRAKIHPPGTIIFPKIGGAIATNKRRILTRGSAIDNNCLGITFSSALNVEWAFLLLKTLDFTRYQAGTAVPALQQGVLERIPVGLPPLAEQHRIVARVDELMGLCDRLEASLIATAATRRRLLDALLAEALAPVDAREFEAVE